MKKEIDIIYEDSDIILCHKPAGMATQTKRLGQQDMESFLKNYRAKKGESPYIGIVHRLDQPVEGIMVFAKNQKAAASLSKQVQQRMLGKYYYAVSAYVPTQKQGALENYLVTDKKTNITTVIDEANLCPTENSNLINYEVAYEGKQTNIKRKSTSNIQKSNRKNFQKEAKYAKLEYEVLGEQDGNTLFKIKLHTGRQHQIRVQMAHMGCSLIGDSKYGKIGTSDSKNFMEQSNVSVREHYSAFHAKEGLALCSYQLEFCHPITGKEMQFSIIPEGEIFQNFNISQKYFS